MDDAQNKRLMRSLRFRLASRLAFLVLCFAIVAGFLAFVAMMHRSVRLLDGELVEAAISFDANSGSLSPGRDGADGDFFVAFLPVSEGDNADLAVIDATIPNGLRTIEGKAETWRIFVFTQASGERFVVATPEDRRLRLVGRIVVETVLPYLLLILCLIGGIILTVGKILDPVRRLALALDKRDEQDLRPLEQADLPAEIQPFVEAINRLLDRVAASASRQRRFVADAAHELRSPLAALILQAERLAMADLSPEAKARLATMRDGLSRSRALLAQMLAMARAQERQFGPAESFSATRLAATLFETVLPQAEAKDIVLGLAEGEEVSMTAPIMAVELVLGNLLENAVRYTPEQGAVALQIVREGRNVVFRVTDNGPGIPKCERERAFDPFYRCSDPEIRGSGLGLSIVKTVLEHLGGDIALDHANSSAPHGLLVVVRLPG